MRIRLAATVLLAVVVAALTATPVLAHVTVEPTLAERGSTVKFTFTVPNEKPGLDTVKVAIQFPSDHPIGSVTVDQPAGWTAHVTTTRLQAPIQTAHGQVSEAVSQVVWDGGTIAPGQFQDFQVEAGPLPSDVQVLLFPTTQTYSDGSEVQWSQQSFEGQATPESPAPQVEVAGKGKKDKSSSTSTTQLVAVAALLVGIAGLVVGGLAYIRVRRWR